MLDFPTPTSIGQVYTGTNGVTYIWDGTLWLASGASAGGDFMATHSIPFNMAATATVLVLDTVKTGNSPTAYYSTSTGRYTPPAGRYAISVSLYGTNAAASIHVEVALYKNGVSFASARDTTPTNAYGNAVVNATVDANGVDYFDIRGFASTGGGSANAYFTAYPISGIKGPPGDPTPGTLIQTQSFQTGAVATGTTLIPTDNTIPQITEGNEYMILAITPRSATSKLVIDAIVCLSSSIATNLTVTLFQDSAPNALAAAFAYQATATGLVPISLRHTMVSGTTSATTFRIRGGAPSAGTTTFNGAAGGPLFGGVVASSIVIQEVAP